jgi:hypothetical protein
MDAKRRTRFEGRVELEREFLTPVNKRFGSISPLSGMTRDAIESWRRRASTASDPAKVGKVADILLQASSRAHLLADNSKDVFEPERRPSPSSVELLRDMLTELLAET